MLDPHSCSASCLWRAESFPQHVRLYIVFVKARRSLEPVALDHILHLGALETGQACVWWQASLNRYSETSNVFTSFLRRDSAHPLCKQFKPDSRSSAYLSSQQISVEDRLSNSCIPGALLLFWGGPDAQSNYGVLRAKTPLLKVFAGDRFF